LIVIKYSNNTITFLHISPEHFSFKFCLELNYFFSIVSKKTGGDTGAELTKNITHSTELLPCKQTQNNAIITLHHFFSHISPNHPLFRFEPFLYQCVSGDT